MNRLDGWCRSGSILVCVFRIGECERSARLLNVLAMVCAWAVFFFLFRPFASISLQISIHMTGFVYVVVCEASVSQCVLVCVFVYVPFHTASQHELRCDCNRSLNERHMSNVVFIIITSRLMRTIFLQQNIRKKKPPNWILVSVLAILLIWNRKFRRIFSRATLLLPYSNWMESCNSFRVSSSKNSLRSTDATERTIRLTIEVMFVFRCSWHTNTLTVPHSVDNIS